MLSDPIAAAAADASDTSPPESEPRLFTVKVLPRKGRGLVAERDISIGEKILCEKPLLTVGEWINPIVMNKDIAEQVRKLSKDEQRHFLSLHNNSIRHLPFWGIVATNGISCSVGSDITAIYTTVSLINHSCIPNALPNWNAYKLHQTVYAVQEIKAGEEITVPYMLSMLPFIDRQEDLRNRFGFSCICDLCSAGNSVIELSDARRKKTGQLSPKLNNEECRISDPEDTLSTCRQLLELYNIEYGTPYTGLHMVVWEIAARIAALHSDQARASVFATRAYSTRTISQENDCPRVMGFTPLMNDPTAWSDYGTSEKWKTTKDQIPTGLDSADFEEWLWTTRVGVDAAVSRCDLP